MESNASHNTIGHHYIVEGSGCDRDVIGSVARVQQILAKAAEVANAKIWSISFQFAMKAFGASDMHATEVTRGLEELEEGERIFYHSIVTWEEELPEQDAEMDVTPKK